MVLYLKHVFMAVHGPVPETSVHGPAPNMCSWLYMVLHLKHTWPLHLKHVFIAVHLFLHLEPMFMAAPGPAPVPHPEPVLKSAPAVVPPPDPCPSLHLVKASLVHSWIVCGI